MAQYNFYIDDELKEKTEKVLADSGITGKPKFLEEMVKVYQIHLASKTDIKIDMSAYQNTNEQSKEAIQKAFTHILTTLDYNFSTLQQDKIYIEEEKQTLDSRTEEVKIEVEKLKLEAHEELKKLTVKNELEKSTFIEENKKILEENIKNRELLEKSQKELKSLSSIAEQTNNIMQENKELRANTTELQNNHSLEIDKLKKSHTNLEEQYNTKMDLLRASNEKLQESMNKKDKELFEATHTLTKCKEDLVKYDKKQKEFEEITSKYNQLLGKIEILESLKGKNEL
jgi:chromosome segregation ATPase